MKSIKGLLILFLLLTGLICFTSCDESVTNQIIAQLVTHGWTVGDSTGGYGYILRTTDAGDTWTRQGDSSMLANISLNDLAVVDKQTVWIVGTQGTVLYTTDSGNSWQKQTTPPNDLIENLSSISAIDENNAWISGANGVVLHTVNGGNTWDRVIIAGAPASLLLQGMYAVDANNIWGAGEDGSGLGYIYNTTDAGSTWSRINPFVVPPDSASWIGVQAITINDVWVHGGVGKLIHTTDAGQTWTHVPNPQQWLPIGGDINDICFYNANTGYFACDYDNILYTTNGGTNWISQMAPAPGNDFLVGVHTISPSTAWIVGLGFQSDFGKIVYTTDNGANWNVKMVTDTRLNHIAFVK